MSPAVFALIIGIDKYKSGNIWNLESCVDDAQNMRRWLTRDLHVPRDQICLLTDSAATRTAIEDSFMSHLVNNPAIEPGDAIIIYFAGHGSTIRSPPGWYTDGRKDVEMLCSYDHDSKSTHGRVAGISDRSFHAMLRDLCDAKGDNITVILDCSFTTSNHAHERKHTRWTPTTKCTSDDLFTGLWRSALARSDILESIKGFTATDSDTHVILAASQPGMITIENKHGGAFTHALLSIKDTVPLHTTTYVEFAQRIAGKQGRLPVVRGRNKNRIVFDSIPFLPDTRYVPIETYDSGKIRVEAGAIHGIIAGTEFSIHTHNCHSSLNPPLTACYASEVHPTWCIADKKSPGKMPIHQGWARVTRWNNRVPFRVHLRNSFFSFMRRFRLRRIIDPSKAVAERKPSVNIIRVKHGERADVSVRLRRREMALERNDTLIGANCRRIIDLPSKDTQNDVKLLDAAARFHLHLHRKNPERPLRDLVSMELYCLDPVSWTRVSDNLLVDGRAQILLEEQNTIFSVEVKNHSNIDLFPYLAYLDTSGYGINMLYQPNKASDDPPLKKHSQLVIGSGTTDSKAVSFTLADGLNSSAGFLKLFVSSVPTPMSFIEQGHGASAGPSTQPSNIGRDPEKLPEVELWDSLVACVTIVRRP